MTLVSCIAYISLVVARIMYHLRINPIKRRRECSGLHPWDEWRPEGSGTSPVPVEVVVPVSETGLQPPPSPPCPTSLRSPESRPLSHPFKHTSSGSLVTSVGQGKRILLSSDLSGSLNGS